MKKTNLILLPISILLCSFIFDVNKPSYVSAASGLKLREKPSVYSTTIETIPYGTKVTVKEKGAIEILDGTRGQWCRIEWKGKKGWVFGAYLTDKEPDANKYNDKTLSGYYEFVYRFYNSVDASQYKMMSEYLQLNEDGSFDMSVFDWQCFQTIVLSGSYTISNDSLNLHITHSNLRCFYKVGSFDIKTKIISANELIITELVYSEISADKFMKLNVGIDKHLLLPGKEPIKQVRYVRTKTPTYHFESVGNCGKED